MGGAACVLAIAQMVMDAKLPVRLRVLIPAVENLMKLNVPIFATEGTANFLNQRGYPVEKVHWSKIESKVIELIKSGKIDFIINLPKNYSHTELENGYKIRTAAVGHGCTLLTNIEKANVFLQALTQKNEHEVRALGDQNYLT